MEVQAPHLALPDVGGGEEGFLLWRLAGVEVAIVSKFSILLGCPFLALQLDKPGIVYLFACLFLYVPISISRLKASPIPTPGYIRQKENPGNSPS